MLKNLKQPPKNNGITWKSRKSHLILTFQKDDLSRFTWWCSYALWTKRKFYEAFPTTSSTCKNSSISSFLIHSRTIKHEEVWTKAKVEENHPHLTLSTFTISKIENTSTWSILHEHDKNQQNSHPSQDHNSHRNWKHQSQWQPPQTTIKAIINMTHLQKLQEHARQQTLMKKL